MSCEVTAQRIGIFFIFFFTFVAGDYGQPCLSEKSTCSEWYLKDEECINGTCQCAKYHHQTLENNLHLKCNNKQLCGTRSCPDGLTCISEMFCQCPDDLLFVKDKGCLSATYFSPMEKCKINDNPPEASLCDYEQFSFCNNGTCVCFKDYYYNSTSESCESKNTYAVKNNVTTYRSMPGEYCLEIADCVLGLKCNVSYMCTCPEACPVFDEKYLICDCGQLDFQAPTSVLIVGILLGLLSVCCWCKVIRKTIKKHRRQSEELNSLGLPVSSSTIEDPHSSNIPEEVPKQMPFPDYPPPPYSSLELPGVCSTENSSLFSKSDPAPPYNPLPYPLQPNSMPMSSGVPLQPVSAQTESTTPLDIKPSAPSASEF